MKTTFKVVPYVLDDQGNHIPGAEAFVRRYAQYRTDLSNALSIDDWGVASRALSDAHQIGLPVHLFYSFEIAPDEIEAHDAFYLGLKITEDVLHDNVLRSKHLKKFNIVQDFTSEQIFVDERARQVLERNTQGLAFCAFPARSQGAWYRIDSVAELLEPVCIPKTMFLDENEEPAGTYIVQSDGRDVLSESARNFVREHGLVVANRFKTGSMTSVWRPRLIASGRLIAALDEAHINGILTPLAPLLRSDDPLTGGTCA